MKRTKVHAIFIHNLRKHYTKQIEYINAIKINNYETDFYYYLDGAEHSFGSYRTRTDLLEWYCR